ncbi:hypothetical protein [Streptomyces sp. MZ04]|uniref:hypothetical protein n=1 Tax=Streptomyces sp. MZ04 TaxID=2559236 RepID=UPI00107E7B94|nr:hypothetical protein [Streptomyces sp. MZ04]TGB08287.1 hypothetical protein E2651_19630 [Streptomyces sp. MZ04]
MGHGLRVVLGDDDLAPRALLEEAAHISEEGLDTGGVCAGEGDELFGAQVGGGRREFIRRVGQHDLDPLFGVGRAEEAAASGEPAAAEPTTVAHSEDALGQLIDFQGPFPLQLQLLLLLLILRSLRCGNQTDGSGVRLLVEPVTEAADGHATF